MTLLQISEDLLIECFGWAREPNGGLTKSAAKRQAALQWRSNITDYTAGKEMVVW